eukprot:3123196-Pyramimonas_sp.AAC.1
MGGLPMYLTSVGDADVTRGESAPEKIMRMQKMLGGAFNGAWSAWARKVAHKQGSACANIKSDPRRNTVQQCDDLLQAWSKVGYDAYKLDR